jgi:predicted DCC family thiol-disulfide oxidoreductase YuxK
MLSLTVLYDPECGLCRRAHDWLSEQVKLVEMLFVPCASEEARKRYPHLNHELTRSDLTVIGNDGAVYFGPKAWLMVLWALARYRDWSYRLATPELLPTTKKVVSAITQNRYHISRIAGLAKS